MYASNFVIIHEICLHWILRRKRRLSPVPSVPGIWERHLASTPASCLYGRAYRCTRGSKVSRSSLTIRTMALCRASTKSWRRTTAQSRGIKSALRTLLASSPSAWRRADSFPTRPNHSESAATPTVGTWPTASRPHAPPRLATNRSITRCCGTRLAVA